MPKRFLSTWRGLPRPLYSLLAVQIVQSSGGFVQPFLALLLTTSLGFDTAQTGLFLTLNTLAMIPGTLWGGRLVDRWGRKRVLVISRTLTALCLAPCALLDGQLPLAFLLMASSVVASFGYPAFPATVTDMVPSERRSDAFSLLYLGHNLGFAIGTSIAGLLFATARPWLFWGETIMVCATLFLLVLLVPETRPERHEEAAAAGEEAPHAGGLWSALLTRPLLLIFTALIALVWLGYSQIWFAAPLWLSEVYGAAGPPLYGVFMSATALFVLVVTPLLSRWLAGRPPALVIAMGALLMGAGFFLFLWAGWIPLLFFAGFVLTVGEVLWATGAPAYLANHSPVTHRGRFNSVLNALQNTGSMAGPWLGGLASGAWGLAALWPLALVVNFTAAAGLWGLHRREHRRL